MRKSILAGVGLLALAGATAGTVAAQSAPTAWLHVRVDEVRDNTKVSVNLPLSVVEAVLKASPEILEKHGRVHIGKHHGLELADLRRVWKELAAVGDAELVSVESDDENVKVQRKGDVVQVFVEKKPWTDKEGKNEHAHMIAAGTKVTLDGKDARLADLKKGDGVKVTMDPEGKVVAVAATRAKG